MPSSRSRRARRLVARIEQSTTARREAWADGDRLAAERLTRELNGERGEYGDVRGLHDDKRVMRRAIYRDAPELEGRPVFKGRPGVRPSLTTEAGPPAGSGKTAGAGGRDARSG